jgi:hypothetical protein
MSSEFDRDNVTLDALYLYIERQKELFDNDMAEVRHRWQIAKGSIASLEYQLDMVKADNVQLTKGLPVTQYDDYLADTLTDLGDKRVYFNPLLNVREAVKRLNSSMSMDELKALCVEVARYLPPETYKEVLLQMLYGTKTTTKAGE